jgi:ribosomal-protein-alanine N-acetyltransferase
MNMGVNNKSIKCDVVFMDITINNALYFWVFMGMLIGRGDNMIKLETDRLIIRDHTEDDIVDLHKLLSDSKVMYYLQDLKTNGIEESESNLRVSINESNSDSRGKYFLAITDKKTNEYIGEIGVTKLLDSKFGNKFELGYFILEKYWGKGIVTESSRAVLDYCFNELNAMKVIAGCNKDNLGSEKIMKKLGMVKEAEFINHVVLNGKICDRVEYRMLKEEWKKHRG